MSGDAIALPLPPSGSGLPASLAPPPAETEVKRWVREIQAGVEWEKNFQRLFQLYSPGLYHFLLHFDVEPDDALDLIQETFFRVYQHIDGFRFDSSFKTWLFEIARNLWRNSLRSRAAEKRRGEEVSLGNGVQEEAALLRNRVIAPEAALQDLLAAEEAAQLHQAVRQLPPQMRLCVQLFFQGLSYPQIARIMQTEVATVKSQMYQARQRLRVALGEYFNPYDFDPGGPA